MPRPCCPTGRLRPIGPEPRPPRPLAPSSAGEEQGADPPLPPGVRGRGGAARRADPPAARAPARCRAGGARGARRAPGSRATRAELADDERARHARARAGGARRAATGPSCSRPRALAEVPLAATVGGQVIAGTADRLLVEPRPRAGGRFQDRAPPARLARRGAARRRCGRWPPMPRRWRRSIRPADRGGAALHPDAAADRDSRRNCSRRTNRA